MINKINIQSKSNDNSEDLNKSCTEHLLTLPANWWLSQNSYDHLTNQNNPPLQLIKPNEKKSIADYEIPYIKGWDVKDGDYRVKTDEPERDFKEEKIKFKYRMFTAAIVVTFFTVWLVSMLVSKFAVMK
ncbi:MAG: hypothetical protein Q8N03_00805 [Ignavibacteria bacterium]|nr:hypothetical protein [Ignavibacteria bacterium]